MLLGILLAVAAGILAGQFTHAVGAAPILAALLCAACFLRKRDVALIGIVAILTRDVLTGISWFTVVRVVAIVSVVGVVRLLSLRPSLSSLLMVLGLSAPIYHLALSIGDWVTHTCSQEPWTLAGLIATLTSSFPYALRSVLGDVVFTSAFMGLYTFTGYVVSLRWPSLFPNEAAVDSV